MFAAPRFIAVDDNPSHLNAIVETFQRLGSPCLGIHYDPAEDMDAAHFSGVRVLFLDLHLLGSGAGTDDTKHYANIVSILQSTISVEGGPFILVLWTQFPEKAQALTEYLDSSITPEFAHARPLTVMPLAKSDFINTDSGEIVDDGGLRRWVKESLAGNVQMQALVGWEHDVVRAAGRTLSSLVSLIPAESRVTAKFAGELDLLLSRLAIAAVGTHNVSDDARAAVNAVLAPILADRVLNQDEPEGSVEVWSRAVTRVGTRDPGPPDEKVKGAINRSLHIAVPASEKIMPDGWGAVCAAPSTIVSDKGLGLLFGLNRKSLLSDEFAVQDRDLDRAVFRLVRIGAACDYAQRRPGPIAYVLAIELSSAAKFRGKAKDALWRSPTILLEDTNEPVRLRVNCRFMITRTSKAVQRWTVCYRLREQLLVELINHAADYASRPGIISLN